MKTWDEVEGIECIWHLFQQHEPAELRMCILILRVHMCVHGSVCVRESTSPQAGLWTFEQRHQPEQTKNAGLVQVPAFGGYPIEIQMLVRERVRKQKIQRNGEKWSGRGETDKEIMRMLHWQRHTTRARVRAKEKEQQKSHAVFQTDEHLSILEPRLQLSQNCKVHENKKASVTVANCHRYRLKDKGQKLICHWHNCIHWSCVSVA